MKEKFANKISLVNILTSIILQFVTIISGFVIPKIILSCFGSNVNGLVSSLGQFLSYITIVEGGVSGIVIANLYQPILENDRNKISNIINTSQHFYRKIGLVFIIYSVVLAIVYPLIFNTNFSFEYIFFLTIVLSIALLIQYMFSLTYKCLLIADKKVYIISTVQIIIISINTLASILLAKTYPNIHLIKLISGIIYFIQPLFFNYYINKHYSLDKSIMIDNSLINQRWNGFAINVASFIHNSTDISILTIFTNLAIVSVYSVYALVTNGIKQIITSIASSITPTIGQAYAKNNIYELNIKLDLYEYIIDFLTFYFSSVSVLLITPFILLYTKGLSDAHYSQGLFGILLIISEMIYLIKLPHLNLAYSANKFKDITKPAFIEAIINIVISVILVAQYGLIGVAIGTIIAMTYRTIFHVYFTKKMINRNQWEFYKKIIIFLVSSIIGIILCYLLYPPFNLTLFDWIVHGIVYSIVLVLLYVLASAIFFKKEVTYVFRYLKK